MARRTFFASALIAAATLAACAIALLAASREAEAAFPGRNGSIFHAKYEADEGGDSGIYAVDPDGSGPTRLTRNTTGGRDTDPAVSPDGTRILFSRYLGFDGRSKYLYVVNADGTGLRKLAAGRQFLNATWSPDGSRIAFARPESAPDGPYGPTDLWVMDADGSDERKLVDTPDAWEGQLAWSPGGDRIAFARSRPDQGDGDGEIYAADADGSDQVKLTDNDAQDTDPDWSPDGARLAFSSDRGAGAWGIYTVDADGSDQERIPVDTSPSGGFDNLEFRGDQDPAWSPDGTRLAFSRERYNPEYGRISRDVFTANADGSGLDDMSSFYRDVQPAWQPLADPTAPVPGPPETTIILGPRGAGGPSAAFDFVSSRPGATFECSVDGAPFAACEGPERYEGLRAGGHRFAVRAVGPDGTPDPTPAERTWSVRAPDTAEPTITRPYPAPGAGGRDRTPTVGATVRDAGGDLARTDMRLYLDGAAKSFSYNPPNDRLSRTTSRLSLGKHRVKVVAKDAAGNTATKVWTFRVVGGR